jgi:hypothetical protein
MRDAFSAYSAVDNLTTAARISLSNFISSPGLPAWRLEWPTELAYHCALLSAAAALRDADKQQPFVGSELDRTSRMPA